MTIYPLFKFLFTFIVLILLDKEGILYSNIVVGNVKASAFSRLFFI